MDQIKQMLDTMDQLTDDQLVELQNSIVTEFEAVEGEEPTSETVETMTTLADMLDTVRAESKRRSALAQELAVKAAEATERVKSAQAEEESMAAEDMPAEDMPPAEEMPAEEMPEEEAPAEEPPMNMDDAEEEEKEDEAMFAADSTNAAILAEEGTELSTETTTETETTAVAEVAELSTTAPEEEQKDQEASMTAAAEDGGADVHVQAPADRRPVAREAAPVVITAGADIPGYTAGAQMSDYNEIAAAMASRLHGLRRVKGGDGEQHIVASITTRYPDERVLTQDTDSNVTKIQAVTGPEALVASGGHSTPFEVRYDIFGFGTTVRPVRDSLPRFQADRGGIRYIQPPTLADYGDAVGVWTNATDTDPGSEVKNSLTVTAASELTVATDAVTLQLQFGNLMTRAYPELIARHNELALIQHAREAEQYLLNKLTAGSTAVTSASLIGVARDFLVQVGRAAAAYRSRYRLDPTQNLRVIAPSWVKDAMVADLALAMPGDSTLNVAQSEIEGYLSARGVSITWTPDLNVFGAQSVGAMVEFSDTFTWYMFAEGTFLFLDGGTLDIGIIRDSTLVGTNDYRMFVETFEGIAKVGIESLVVTSTISVNGAAAALRDTTGGATAAAIEY